MGRPTRTFGNYARLCRNGGAAPPAVCVLDDLWVDAEALTKRRPVHVVAVHRSGLKLVGHGDNETTKEPCLCFATE